MLNTLFMRLLNCTILLMIISALLTGCLNDMDKTSPMPITTSESNVKYDVKLIFPVDKYPETAAHIVAALKRGETPICTIDREGADNNRDHSLKGIPTKEGYDRDEFPMAMCDEGGTGADVAYVHSSDNRGSGSWVGNQLADYPDGTRVLIIVKNANTDITSTAPLTNVIVPTRPSNSEDISYNNCTEVREAKKAPLHKGDPGYNIKLDRDQDGVACE